LITITPGAMPRARFFGPFRAVLAILPMIPGVAKDYIILPLPAAGKLSGV